MPPERRRRAARLCLPVALVLIAVGVVSWSAPAPATVRALASVVGAGGLLLGAIALGLLRSLAADRRDAADAAAERTLDAVLVEASGGAGCACGHEHDPTELHITDAHDQPADSTWSGEPTTAGSTTAGSTRAGSTAACAIDADDCRHDCASCMLAGLRH